MLQLQSSKQEPSFICYNHYVDFIRPHVDSAKSLSAVLTKAISGLAVFEPRVGSCRVPCVALACFSSCGVCRVPTRPARAPWSRSTRL